LGFTFRYDRDLLGRGHRYLNVFPSRKALARLRDKVREITGPQWGWKPVTALIGELNRYLRGWSRYFQHGYPARAFHHVNGYIQARVSRHLRRRSQRRYRPPAGQTMYAHQQQLGLRLLAANR
jgi:RNA-directed DNA polymerase